MEWQGWAGAGWVTLAMLAAGLAGVQGRSKLWWFFVTLLFGPFALFFLVIWTEPLTRREP
ncbi:antitermination protein NusB [Microbacterium esteraromaticum]|uniref:Antitermination protein NusB n=1 Tax=Microbacterium esteraromaticum TaxID=57043 RepID=A0A7D7W9L4_9MICO|nr:antitermination protein NusB [Microbacterium esteraromaticum]QMU97038.1 antitermination protein NusB [Microbacterium esteraromaticum]